MLKKHFCANLNFYAAALHGLCGTVHPVRALLNSSLGAINMAYLDCLQEFFDNPLGAFVHGDSVQAALLGFLRYWSQKSGTSIAALLNYILVHDLSFTLLDDKTMRYYNEPAFAAKDRY
jgi:hypothetical protein